MIQTDRDTLYQHLSDLGAALRGAQDCALAVAQALHEHDNQVARSELEPMEKQLALVLVARADLRRELSRPPCGTVSPS